MAADTSHIKGEKTLILNEKCKEHTSQDVSAWCVDCKEEVCSHCMINLTSKKHIGHTFREIEYATVQIRSSAKEQIQQVLQEFDSALAEQEEIESTFDDANAKLRTLIDDRRKQVQDILESWVDKSQKDLAQKVNQEREILNKVKAKLQARRDELNTALESAMPDITEVVDNLPTIKQDLCERYEPSLMRLKGSDVSTYNWDSLLGHISCDHMYVSDIGDLLIVSEELGTSPTGTDQPDSQSPVNHKEISEAIYLPLESQLVLTDQVCYGMKCKVNANIRVAARTPSGVLIACVGAKCITHLSEEGATVKRTYTRFKIQDIGENGQQVLHATVHRGHKVMKKSAFFWDTLVNTKPFQPYGFTFTSEDDILVCLHHEQQANITRYSSAGDIQNQINLSTSLMSGVPTCVQIDVNKDILVSDNDHIIAIDKNETVRQLWPADKSTSTKTEINPPSEVSKEGTDEQLNASRELPPNSAKPTEDQISLCMTVASEFIYILDNNIKTITVLDNSRSVVATSKDLMTHKVSCITSDKNKNMWIACREGKMYTGKTNFK